MNSPATAQCPPFEHPSEHLEILRQIHWAARQVLHGNLARSLDMATLERLRGSVSRQADEVRALQQKLAGTDAAEAVGAELVQLGASFEEIEKELARRTDPQEEDPRAVTPTGPEPA